MTFRLSCKSTPTVLPSKPCKDFPLYARKYSPESINGNYEPVSFAGWLVSGLRILGWLVTVLWLLVFKPQAGGEFLGRCVHRRASILLPEV